MKQDNWTEMLAELSDAQTKAGNTDAVLAKAIPTEDDGKDDDKKIVNDAKEGKDADEDEDEMFGKSFGVTLEDGNQYAAYDGTKMMKALLGQHQKSSEVIKSAITLVKSLQGTVDTQAGLIKSLQLDVARLGGEGRGRKATLSVHEKPGATNADNRPAQLGRDELMTKSLGAMSAGRITGADIARIESYANRGIAIPTDLLARIG